MEVSSSQLNRWIDLDLNDFISSGEDFTGVVASDILADGQVEAVDNPLVNVGSPDNLAIGFPDDLGNDDTWIDMKIDIMHAASVAEGTCNMIVLEDYAKDLNAFIQELPGNEDSVNDLLQMHNSGMSPKNITTTEEQMDVSSAPIKGIAKIISNEEQALLDLDTKKLNEHLKHSGLAPDEVRLLKSRRRTLKNRRYAQKSRNRRVAKASELEITNYDLHGKLERLQMDLDMERLRADLAEERAGAAEENLRLCQEKCTLLENMISTMLQEPGNIQIVSLDGELFSEN